VRLRAEERSVVVAAHIGVVAVDVAVEAERNVVFGLVEGSSSAGSRRAAARSVVALWSVNC
jgi:hypothetical protein